MKTIGMLFGIDTNYPLDVMNYVNTIADTVCKAEEIKIGIMRADDTIDHFEKHCLIFDRISEYVPFYKSYIRLAKNNGLAVIANCFNQCSDDDFSHLAIAQNLGILTPKTCLLPSKWLPRNTSSESMRNLIYPLDWDEVFDYVGFPSFLKSNSYTTFAQEYKVYNRSEFFSAYELTGSNSMILQEIIDFEQYYRCFVIGKKYIKIASYNPYNPMHLRYSKDEAVLKPKIKKEIEDICKKISTHFDYDFNAIEFAVKDGKIYAVEFKSAMPTTERHILHDNNYDWLVENMGEFLVESCSVEI